MGRARIGAAVVVLGGAIAVQGLPAAGAHAAGPTGGGEPPVYEVGAIIDGGTGVGTVGRRINEAGDVAGWTNYPLDGYRWTGLGGMELLLGVGDDENTVATDVNDTGMVAGYSGRQTIEPPQRAVRWVDGEPQDLGSLQVGGDSEATGINDDGTVVGWSTVGFETHAFVWTEDDGMVDITPSGFGFATDVNEAGEVTGYRGSTAYVWSDGELDTLELADGFPFSFGNAINDRGEVAGGITNGTGNAERLVKWSADGEITVLGGLGQDNAMLGINNHGTTVGAGVPSSGPVRGVIHDDAYGLRNVADLLNTRDWGILAAYDINDAGQIVAQGNHVRTGDIVTLRLDPVSGPTMHDRNFRLEVRGTKAVGSLKVVDERGVPVRRAKVELGWYTFWSPVEDVTARSKRNGRVQVVKPVDEIGPPSDIQLCISTINHRRYTYVPTDGAPPPCRSTAD